MLLVSSLLLPLLCLKSFCYPIGLKKLVLSFSTETVSVVNAIEIVSVVDKLFKDSVAKVGGSEMELGRGMETYVCIGLTFGVPS